MDPKAVFKKSLQQATGCVRHVRREQLNDITPCTEWNLRELLNHVVYEMLWIPDILAGKTIREVGNKYEGDVLGDDIQAAWQRAAEAAAKAVAAADLDKTVHLSYGDLPARTYLAEVGGDILIHGWDIGQSIRCTILMDKPLAQAVYDYFLSRKDSLTAGGAFAAPLEVPEGADVQTKLLALLGRNAQWYKSKVSLT